MAKTKTRRWQNQCGGHPFHYKNQNEAYIESLGISPSHPLRMMELRHMMVMMAGGGHERHKPLL
jgi:hypothetical protein